MNKELTETKLSKHILQLCEELGPLYSIQAIDWEYVIYRDFGNGFDVEVCGMDTGSANKLATIYLWHQKTRIVNRVDGVRQNEIADHINELCILAQRGNIPLE